MFNQRRWGDISRLVYGKALGHYGETAGPVRVFGTNGPIGYATESQSAGPGVIVGRKGAYRGVHYSPGPFWVIDTAYYLVPADGIDIEWAYYALKVADIQGLGSGSAVPSTTREDFYALPVVVPGIREQVATAEVLTAFDRKISANNCIARSSLELARSIFRHEQEAGLWDPVTLGDICARGWLQLGDGYRTRRSEHAKPGLRILRAGDVGPDSINPSGGDFVSVEFRAVIGPKASQPGDVVLTTKGTVGRVAVVPSGMEQVVYSPQLCYFRVLDPTRLAPGFLSAWFRSDDLQRQAEARMFKSDMAPYINLRDIQSMTMPLAPPADQHRISESQSALEHMAHAVLHENSILARMRDELLPLLMSGKVRVRDAERRVEDAL